MTKKQDMKAYMYSSGEAPDLKRMAQALLPRIEEFYKDPENVKEYEAWQKERDERGNVMKEKMMKYEPGSKMREILKQTRDQRAMPRGKGKPGLVFSYKLEDAWCRFLHSLEVFDGKYPYVRYSFFVKSKGKKSDPLGEGGEISIGNDALENIKSILTDDRLFEAQWLEEPYEMGFLDGITQIFRIENGDKSICAEGDNLGYCRDDAEHCPHTVLMIHALEKVEEILAPLGVPEVCFRLDG